MEAKYSLGEWGEGGYFFAKERLRTPPFPNTTHPSICALPCTVLGFGPIEGALSLFRFPPHTGAPLFTRISRIEHLGMFWERYEDFAFRNAGITFTPEKTPFVSAWFCLVISLRIARVLFCVNSLYLNQQNAFPVFFIFIHFSSLRPPPPLFLFAPLERGERQKNATLFEKLTRTADRKHGTQPTHTQGTAQRTRHGHDTRCEHAWEAPQRTTQNTTQGVSALRTKHNEPT